MIRFKSMADSIGQVAAPAHLGSDYLALPRTGTITPVVASTPATTVKITDDRGFKNLRINTAGYYNMHYHDLSANSVNEIPSTHVEYDGYNDPVDGTTETTPFNCLLGDTAYTLTFPSALFSKWIRYQIASTGEWSTITELAADAVWTIPSVKIKNIEVWNEEAMVTRLSRYHCSLGSTTALAGYSNTLTSAQIVGLLSSASAWSTTTDDIAIQNKESYFQKFIRESVHAYYLQGQEVFETPSHIEAYTPVTVAFTTPAYSFSATSGQVYDILIARKNATANTATIVGCSRVAGYTCPVTILDKLNRQDVIKVRVIASATTVSLTFDALTGMYNLGATSSDVKVFLVTGIAPGDITAEF